MGRFITTALKAVELLVLSVFFGLVPVAGIFIAVVLFAAIVLGKESLGPWVLWSLMPGVLIDVLFLKRWVKNAYKMSIKVLGALYIFHSVCALGLFMGVPIGDVFLGILVGIYSARRLSSNTGNSTNPKVYFQKAAIFSAAVMVVVCILLTLWAIAGRVQSSTFQTPLISFTFTWPIFLAAVVAGGAFLVLLQYWLTMRVAEVTFNLCD
jgi:hypothetical protein